LLRLEELLRCSLRLDESEIDEFVPHFLKGDDPAAQVKAVGSLTDE
jgi:hypothetical protein